MALLKYGDRVREATATEGSSDYVLTGTTDPLEQTFVDGIGDGEWCYYCCESVDDWEIGYGQIVGTTLTRDTILGSSNAGLKVPWSVGSKTVFNTATAASLDHIAGFVINDSNISFNRAKKVGIAAQDTYDHIYLRGSLEVYVDGALIAESEYTATDGATVVFNTPMTGGEIIEFIAVGQYTSTVTQYDTPVPTGQLFKSDLFLNSVWRNTYGADGIASNCTKVIKTNVDGDGVLLNGTSSAINFTDFGFDHSAAFTLAFWFKTAATLADACLISNQSGLDTDGYLHVKTTALGNIVVAVLDGTDVEQTVTHSISANTEYHVTVQYTGTELSLWIDGTEGTPITTTIKTTTPTNDFAIGYKVNGAVDYCAGEVYAMNLYASSLSDTDIAAIYSEPNGPNTSDMPAITVPGGSVATNDDIISMVIALG